MASFSIVEGVNTVEAASPAEWRAWLAQHHNSVSGIWLIIYRKESGVPSVYYPEAVDEALCYGWVDSAPRKRDAVSYYLYCTPRKPKSNWSRVNKEKVAQLRTEGKMTEAGERMVTLAKANGRWEILDGVDRLDLPDDLLHLLKANREADQNWQAFSPSSRRGILEWILNAKQPATRQKRIEETVRLAAQNIKANHPR
jgi:uncharacterized protein YdeI (YjbR/CyaY-like superfamily)